MHCVSPCENCGRVAQPQLCEDKSCMRWRRWYLDRWEKIHGFYLRHQKDSGR